MRSGRYLCLICVALLLALSFPTKVTAGAAARLGELKSRIEKHAAGLPAEKRLGPGRLAEAKLAVRKAEALRSRKSLPYLWPVSLERAVNDAAKAVDALEEPQAAGGPRTGFQERAYISRIDGSAEPYLLYVPGSYNDKRAWPLLVFLHGYHPNLDVTTWIYYMYSATLQDVCEREGVILLMPYGRSNTEFMGIGEGDVLETSRYVRGEYRVDPRRIFISGASMGGSGAYSIACHHPHLFAGVVAITGRVDYYSWMNVPKGSLPRFKQIRMDTDYARELLPNLAHVPVVIFHGELDTAVSAGQSRLMHKLMSELGQRCEYVKFRGMGHYGTWSESFLHERFLTMLRNEESPERPERVTFRTFTLKYPRAYWVTIDEMQVCGQASEVRAEVIGKNRIAVETHNVAALTLGPGLPEDVDARDVLVVANGRNIKPTVTSAGALSLRISPAQKWTGPRKMPRLCGPIREAYDGPFVIVCPAAKTPEAVPDRENAKRLAREWEAYAQARPLLRLDTEITEEDIQSRNLILCGSPATNELLARIADKLPLRIEPDAYRVGAHSFPPAGNGIQFIYPNPLNQRRYVLIVHGTQWAPGVQQNHKLDFLPDFIIYAAETAEDGTWFPTNRFLCAGYFDTGWRLSGEITWLGGGNGDP